MANWYGASRSNYFKVKDADAFQAWANKIGLGVWRSDDTFAVCSESGEGWPSCYLDDDYDAVDVELHDELAEHLAEGEVAVLMETGAEKLRYVTGWAIAVAWDGRTTEVSINDIYDKAFAAFGVRPRPAED